MVIWRTWAISAVIIGILCACLFAASRRQTARPGPNDGEASFGIVSARAFVLVDERGNPKASLTTKGPDILLTMGDLNGLTGSSNIAMILNVNTAKQSAAIVLGSSDPDSKQAISLETVTPQRGKGPEILSIKATESAGKVVWSAP